MIRLTMIAVDPPPIKTMEFRTCGFGLSSSEGFVEMNIDKLEKKP